MNISEPKVLKTAPFERPPRFAYMRNSSPIGASIEHPRYRFTAIEWPSRAYRLDSSNTRPIRGLRVHNAVVAKLHRDNREESPSNHRGIPGIVIGPEPLGDGYMRSMSLRIPSWMLCVSLEKPSSMRRTFLSWSSSIR